MAVKKDKSIHVEIALAESEMKKQQAAMLAAKSLYEGHKETVAALKAQKARGR
jgi:hypothetical protein